MNNRIIALILAALFITALTVSCAPGKTDSSKDTLPQDTSAEPEDTRIYPDLPEIKYEGYDYRFYSWNIDSWHTWDDIATDDYDGEIINDAVYNRNSVIESRYDVKISCTLEEYKTYENNVSKNVKAGDDFADVLISMGHNIPRMYNQNVFYNLLNVPHLDFDMPWWDSNATESFTLVGYMPFGVSDLTLLDKGVTSCVYFNKQLADDLTLGNLYDLVYENEWTIDKIIELGKKASMDNGDSIYDENDIFGIVCDDDPVFMLFNGSGGRHITKDADGYPELSFANEYNFTMIKHYLENLLYDESLTYNASFTNTKSPIDMFINNQGLFFFKLLNSAVRLRSMETDFGILPIPKYQESQKEYGNAVSVFGTNLISVPLTAGDLIRTGVILEALSAESKYTVIPAFYDVVLKDKFTRDVESTDMLDIIINSRVYDVGDYYGLANFPDNFLRITGKAVNATGISQTSDIASFYAKREKALEKALKDLIKIIDKWNELDLS